MVMFQCSPLRYHPTARPAHNPDPSFVAALAATPALSVNPSILLFAAPRSFPDSVNLCRRTCPTTRPAALDWVLPPWPSRSLPFILPVPVSVQRVAWPGTRGVSKASLVGVASAPSQPGDVTGYNLLWQLPAALSGPLGHDAGPSSQATTLAVSQSLPAQARPDMIQAVIFSLLPNLSPTPPLPSPRRNTHDLSRCLNVPSTFAISLPHYCVPLPHGPHCRITSPGF